MATRKNSEENLPAPGESQPGPTYKNPNADETAAGGQQDNTSAEGDTQDTGAEGEERAANRMWMGGQEK